MKLDDLMIDLETLGTNPGAPVLSIGAVFFDPSTGATGRQFHGKIDVTDALNYARMDGDTFKWWMRQSNEARTKVCAGTSSAAEVFQEFDEFVRLDGAGSVRPWGNGASFDITILDISFKRILNRLPAWRFWNVRDVRTVKELGRAVGAEFTEKQEGTAHDALADAIFQVKYTSFYWQALTARASAEIPEKPIKKESAQDDDDDLDLLG